MADKHLVEISRQLEEGRQVQPLTTRELLSWFGAERRGYWIVKQIRRELNEVRLRTDPDFESAYIDGPISFHIYDDQAGKSKDEKAALVQTIGPGHGGEASVHITTSTLADPTFRISRLAAANKKPTSAAPDETVQKAITVMLANDFSQLPVMTSERDVKGIISWSSIGSRLAVGKSGLYVRELMDNHHEIRAELSLFQAIPVIVQYQYVLVRGSDNKITGIVTATDLSLQFQQLAEPFLLLGEIENHVRRLLGDNFTPDELAVVRDPNDRDRKITRVADLSFGEYVRLLENNAQWQKIRVPIDRQVFVTLLDRVREIRNDVMHFDPDGVPPEDLERLRYFANLLQRLQTIGIPQ